MAFVCLSEIVAVAVAVSVAAAVAVAAAVSVAVAAAACQCVYHAQVFTTNSNCKTRFDYPNFPENETLRIDNYSR
jgi:hypothetical protein